MKDAAKLWDRYQSSLYVNQEVGLWCDFSRINYSDDFLEKMRPSFARAVKFMQELEAGAVANPDEKRMVGHYWLRNANLAPNLQIKNQIEETLSKIKSFAAAVHAGEISPQRDRHFHNILLIGIGGSALGPQFVRHALGSSTDRLKLYCFDNTDASGMQRVLGEIGCLANTLTIVISKSGGTKETRNGMLVAQAAYQAQQLNFGRHVVAVTQEGSELYKYAQQQSWLDIFPMWDWVGGRTSELSAVGLLPAALQGYDIDQMLAGAAACDQLTRQSSLEHNPAGLMALMWHFASAGRGEKDMVVLPYADRLELFSKYLQQLVMESLGKAHDLDGKLVNQGLAVYGNKGSTDQHAYVQQLRDGVNNFFAIFIEVLQAPQLAVEPGISCNDYLSGFFLGTRQALYESQRQSITITINCVDAFNVGLLIALFERSVGIYAQLVNINAYHQPGVEAGKKAAEAVLDLQRRLLAWLEQQPRARSLEQIAEGLGAEQQIESLFKILRQLVANQRLKVTRKSSVFEDLYELV